MPDPVSRGASVLTMLRIARLFVLRPTLKSLGVTPIQLHQQPEAVLEHYAEQLIDFFCRADGAGASRWTSLADGLAQALRTALGKSRDGAVRDALAAVLAYPDSGERAQVLGEQAPQVRQAWHHGCLALVIGRADRLTVVYTLARGIEQVGASTQWPGAEPLVHDVFDGWALSALESALQRIALIDLSVFESVEALDRQLAWATRFADFFTQDPQQELPRHELGQHLPRWLQNAPALQRLAYSKLLSVMANVHAKYQGRSAFDDHGQLTEQTLFNRLFAVQLRRLTLEHCLRGLGDVTYAGYRCVRAAVRTYADQRHDQGQAMGFRPLPDGYLIGPLGSGGGPWLVFRPWSTDVLRQVTIAPQTGPALAEPFVTLAQACAARLKTSPAPSQYGAGWAWFAALMPMAEHPRQTLARLRQIGGNQAGEAGVACQPAWRCEVGLLRSLALRLVYPVTLHEGEQVGAHPWAKRLDSTWSGTRPTLSVLQHQALEKLRRPADSSLATRIEEGIYKGLQWLLGVVIFNKDQNIFQVLSNNRVEPLFKTTINVHQVVGGRADAVERGPCIAPDAEHRWDVQRTPRLRRDIGGLSLNATKMMTRGARLCASVDAEIAESDRLSSLPAPSRPSPVVLQEQLERKAQAFDSAAADILRYTQLRNTPESQAQVQLLLAQAVRLRAHGRDLRIRMTQLSSTPTAGDVQYLLEQRVVGICRLGGRVAETIDGVLDYLQEYEIQDLTDKKRPLWYAHFHYPTLQTGDDQPSKAHIKTLAQRGRGREFERAERAAGRDTQVHRGPITNAATRQMFIRAPGCAAL